MASNTNLQVTGTDFDEIKSNLITYLKGQNILKDADYTGSVLSILTDILAYNTHYNAFYLNMIANELFLDSSTKRSSVVSHAKLLGYTPRSKIAPTAIVDLNITDYELSILNIPKFTKFLSETIDGLSYTFVTTEDHIINNNNGNTSNAIVISDVIIKQGEPATYSFVYNSRKNTKSIFKLPDENIDLESLDVVIQKSRTELDNAIKYKRSSHTLDLNSESEVYFIQESFDGFYEIYFGDGILGKKLEEGNIVVVSYISTDGIAANGAKRFNLIGGDETLASATITATTKSSAYNGREKESIESIKFIAPKSYSAQNRAVTSEDYMALLNNNEYGFAFDSVSVWGGQENNPPVYGQVFVALKPEGGYTLTNSQKEIIKQKIIKPLNVVTVEPQILDPDYTYIKVVVNVVYNQNKTVSSPDQIAVKVREAVQSFSNRTLNSFNSTFSYPELMYTVQYCDPSIVTNECDISLQKKLLPNLTVPTNYELDFDCALERGILSSGISSTPAMSFYDKTNAVTLIAGIYIEEQPSYSGGLESIDIINPGYGYTNTPSINIIGDGFGANAYAVIVNGSLHEIVVDKPGANYTQITVEVVGGGGVLGKVIGNIQGRYGTINSYYYNSKNIKTYHNTNVGTIDYFDGIIKLKDFNPQNVNNPLGQLTITVKPKSNIIYSSKNKILTIDPYDPSSIVVNVSVKS